MNWIKIEYFKFDKTGDVLVIMNNPKRKNELIVRNDAIHYTKYERSNWYNNIIESGKSILKDVDDQYINLWSFSRAYFKNIKAIAFYDDILEEYIQKNN